MPPLALTRPHADLITIKETAALLGLHPRTVRRKIERGEIPAVRLGHAGCAVRVPTEELNRWLFEERV